MNNIKQEEKVNGDDSVTMDNSSTTAILPNQGIVVDALLCKIVSETVFPRKQFLVLENELELNGKVAEKVLSC